MITKGNMKIHLELARNGQMSCLQVYVLGQKGEIEDPNFEPDPSKLDSVEKYFFLLIYLNKYIFWVFFYIKT